MTTRLRRLLLIAATVPGLATAPGLAQEAGFAVRIGPPADPWTEVRIALSVHGEAVEPAAGYVRGCAGHVTGEDAGARIEVTARMDTLTLTLADPRIEALVLAGPDGVFRCVLPDADGLIAARIDGAQPGRYRAWPAAEAGAWIETRLMVADRPVSALELRGLQPDALGPPRAGRHDFDDSRPRQVLAQGAELFAEAPMAPLGAEGCVGFGRFDAPDAVLALEQGAPGLSVFAVSGRDLTIAVRAPDGRILCNDDSFGLNPAVSLFPAPAGDYLIFVGGFSQGGPGDRFDLFASPGAPSWDGAALAEGGPPRMGTVALDGAAARAGQRIAAGPLVPDQPMERLPGLGFCPGFTGLDAPDLVLTLDRPEPMLSLYAMSLVDLVLAVRGPDGQWYCNDDSFGLNPAVSISRAGPGAYHLWVGAYSQGDQGRYNLYAALGAPNWDAAEPAGAAALDPLADPAVGRIAFGPETRIDPRLIFDIAPSRSEARGMGEGCAGYITPEQPDVIIDTRHGLPQLMVYLVSEADGVLLVAGPDGSIHCNDDFEGLNPAVMIPNPQPGPWAVFAGTFGGGGGLATLGVTVASPLWLMDREH